MYSSLLAMLLSVLVALSGAGAATAIPETAVQTTVRDIVVTIDDTAYPIAAEPYFTGAIGTELAAGTFGVQLGNEALLPMQGAIDLNGIRFSLGDTGRVYTITAESFAESLEDFDPAESQLFADLTAFELKLANTSTEEALKASQQSYQALIQTLSPAESTGSVNLGGETVDLKTYSGKLDAQTLSEIMDAMMNSESDLLSDYSRMLLRFYSLIDDINYTSWSEALNVETAETSIDITIAYETAANGDNSYDCITLYGESDDAAQTVDAVLEYTMENGDYSFAMELQTYLYDLQESLSATMNCKDVFTDAPSMDFDITYSSGFTSEYPDTENPEDSFAYGNNTEFSLFGDARTENGLNSLNMDLTTESSYESRSGANLENVDYADSSDASINIAISEAAAENGGVDTTVSLTMEDADDVPISISFVANQVDTIFDAEALFAGGEEILLTDAEDDAGSAKLAADVLAMANDISTLTTQDAGLADLVAAFNALVCSDDDYDGGYDDGPIDILDYDDYYQYLPVDQIMDQFTGAKLAIDVPEGYAVDDTGTFITSENNNATITYRNESENKYIELNLRQTDFEQDDYLVLDGENSGSLIDGNRIATLYSYEDGYYGASLYRDGVDVSLYFSTMSLSEVQALLESLHTIA